MIEPNLVTHTKYRKDIDGLRGIAVLAVVGYHAFPNWIKSGFIGVDIFFVISGFLISGILFSSMESDSFSFTKFYDRRIKRIFPALILVLAASFVFGWFALLPDEYKQLGKHVAGGAGFLSNFVLWREAGYFDNAAETKPLLHLWSLGIEEQFYLTWPLMLWLTRKRRLRQLAICVIVIAVSFAVNLIMVHRNPTADFYSPLSRFWELILGGLLAYLALHKPTGVERIKSRIDAIFKKITFSAAPKQKGSVLREGSAALGVSLIGLGIFTISSESTFPGFWALLPTVGTYLILSAGTEAWLNRKVLSNRFLVWIGLISYPLYLWHWPLLSFARIWEAQLPSREVRVAFVFVSVLLAWLTYSLVEKPIRFRKRGKASSIALCGIMIVIGCLGFSSFERNGFPSGIKDKSDYQMFFLNTPPEYKYSTEHHIFEAYRSECDFYDVKNQTVRDKIDESCYVPNTDSLLFIWGDSHAQQLYYGLRKTLPQRLSILQVATSACTLSLVERSPDSLSACNKSNRFALKIIAERKPQTVLLAQKAGHTSTDFNEIATRLRAMGVRHVLLVGPVPQWKTELYKVIMNNFWFFTPRRSSLALKEDIFETDKALKEKYSGNSNLTYISLTDFFCNSAGCLLYIGNDKRNDIVTLDYGHLLPKTSEFLGKNLLAHIIIGTFPELRDSGEFGGAQADPRHKGGLGENN